MVLQMNPTILVDTPLGRGHAIFIIDYGMHQNSCWVVTLEKNGIVKHFESNDIIVCTNFTYHINTEGNTLKKRIQKPERRRNSLKGHEVVLK